MAKLTKRTVDNAEAGETDYVIWDEDLPGFGLRVFASGKRSYLVQYRAAGRSRRYTIGLHGVCTPEAARREAKVLLGQVARGGNPSEDRKLDREAITVKELCTRYLNDLEQSLILGKRGRPKKATTIVTDTGRIQRHLIPLLGGRRVRDLVKADITQAIKDIIAGKTSADVKTDKLRGRAIVRGGVGTATRTIGLLGGILSYAVELGIIERNPAHSVRKPKDNINGRRLSEQEYRVLGEILRKAAEDRQYATAAQMIRVPCPDRLPAQRDHQAVLERDRFRRQLSASHRQQGGRVGPPGRPIRAGIFRGASRGRRERLCLSRLGR